MTTHESNARIIENPLFIDVPMVTRKTKQLFLESVSSGTIIQLENFPVFCESAEEVKGCIVFEIEIDDLSPLYAPQTKLLVKQVEDWSTMTSGVYAVSYGKGLLTIKRVKDNDLIEKCTLTLYSNPHNRGESSITLDREQIKHIWKADRIVSAPLPVGD